jgi:hypothetical protein
MMPNITWCLLLIAKSIPERAFEVTFVPRFFSRKQDGYVEFKRLMPYPSKLWLA